VTLFAYCEVCKTLFTNGVGRALIHICRTRTEDGLSEDRRELEFRFARYVDDLGARGWVDVSKEQG
jgi:hypothetical protein